MRSSLVLKVAIVLAVLANPGALPVAHAQGATSDDAATAKALFDKGMTHFNLGEYEQAIDKWKEGFRIKQAPEFLYNIGQAHRLSKQADKAIFFYKKYLTLSPKAPNRAEVEKHIASLEKLQKDEQSAATRPPIMAITGPVGRGGSTAPRGGGDATATTPRTATPPPVTVAQPAATPPPATLSTTTPRPVTATQPTATPPVVATTPSPSPGPATSPGLTLTGSPTPAPEKKEGGSNLLLWGAIGAGVLILGSAVVIGIAASGGGNHVAQLPPVNL